MKIETEKWSKEHKTVTAILNERPVNFSEYKATGLEIKRTVIQQGVAIKENFVLFEVRDNSCPK